MVGRHLISFLKREKGSWLSKILFTIYYFTISLLREPLFLLVDIYTRPSPCWLILELKTGTTSSANRIDVLSGQIFESKKMTTTKVGNYKRLIVLCDGK